MDNATAREIDPEPQFSPDQLIEYLTTLKHQNCRLHKVVKSQLEIITLYSDRNEQLERALDMAIRELYRRGAHPGSAVMLQLGAIR